jgi:PAS domain S-box-containing protein
VIDQVINPGTESILVTLVERTRDAIVVTDQLGNVIMANPAFSEMLETEDENQLIGRPLGGWLGTAESGVALTIAALKQNGVVPLTVASLRTEGGRMLRVELSATLLPSGDETSFGFIMRAKNVYVVESPRESAPTRNFH